MYMHVLKTYVVTANKQGERPVKMRVNENGIEQYFHILLFNGYTEVTIREEDFLGSAQQQTPSDG